MFLMNGEYAYVLDEVAAGGYSQTEVVAVIAGGEVHVQIALYG